MKFNFQKMKIYDTTCGRLPVLLHWQLLETFKRSWNIITESNKTLRRIAGQQARTKQQ